MSDGRGKLGRVTSARILFLPLIAALVLAAAGCGKSSKPETASEWANSFCPRSRRGRSR